MSKDCRIVVRMSEELRDWVHAQALLGEQDDAAFVRMVLSNLRRGVAAAPAPVEMPAAQVPEVTQRDVLDVASAPADVAAYDEPQAEVAAAAIDVDAMVAATLEEAEAAGLTQAQIEETQGDMPSAGVRSLMRRPIPFSRATQNARLEQMFGGN